MKYLFLIIITVFFLSCNSQEKRKPSGKSDFQRELNAKFKDASQSPLTKKGLKKFKGLDFFPVDSTYVVIADFIKNNEEKVFSFPTTTDRIAHYIKYGIIRFNIKGKDLELDLYKSESVLDPKYKYHLFLPFLDKTNGKSSYKGGRFIDLYIHEIKDGKIIVDFNKAYNPYCAYSDRYSCPITPRNNFLDIEIKAGVKKYTP